MKITAASYSFDLEGSPTMTVTREHTSVVVCVHGAVIQFLVADLGDGVDMEWSQNAEDTLMTLARAIYGESPSFYPGLSPRPACANSDVRELRNLISAFAR